MAKYPGLLINQDDKYQALYQGLLNMGSNMGGFSSSPTGFMQQLGKGGAALGQGYQGAIAKTKQDQLQEMQAQSQQAQMEAQMMQIEQAKKQQQAQANWLAVSQSPEQNSRPDGTGMTTRDALQAYRPDAMADAQIKAMYPTLGTSLPE